MHKHQFESARINRHSLQRKASMISYLPRPLPMQRMSGNLRALVMSCVPLVSVIPQLYSKTPLADHRGTQHFQATCETESFCFDLSDSKPNKNIKTYSGGAAPAPPRPPHQATGPPTQATGPPTQAPGPPRSGAGVGVGMWRGTADPLLDFFGFRNLSRFHHCEISFFTKQT